MRGVRIPGFKLSRDGKRIEADQKAMDAKLDVSARIAKRKSKRIRVVKSPRIRPGDIGND